MQAEPNDLAPVLGGGPVAWAFEERRLVTTFVMPAEVERRRKEHEMLRARREEDRQRTERLHDLKMAQYEQILGRAMEPSPAPSWARL